MVETLSGGLMRRADIARGLLHGPSVLLLDEPSTGLDPAARLELTAHLRRLCEVSRTTILITTHLLEEAEAADRIAILNRGTLVAEGAPDELKAEIGADVIWVRTPDPEDLRAKVSERFDVEGAVIEGRLRLEQESGHAFIPKLCEAFQGAVREVTLAPPSLGDVFLKRTGHAFVDPPAAPEPTHGRRRKR
jgi:ABC-2 type transport system ATP-binding protein